MTRAIVTPALLPPSALAELKQWLGITTAHDDALLSGLLEAALDICEAFTGLMPLEVEAEEIQPRIGAWQSLATRPIQAIVSVDGIDADGQRMPLLSNEYELELNERGEGLVRVTKPSAPKRYAVRFIAGLTPDWESLPASLRHGIIRLAAHQHRERDARTSSPLPPASVAALWRPWRRMRLI